MYLGDDRGTEDVGMPWLRRIRSAYSRRALDDSKLLTWSTAVSFGRWRAFYGNRGLMYFDLKSSIDLSGISARPSDFKAEIMLTVSRMITKVEVSQKRCRGQSHRPMCPEVWPAGAEYLSTTFMLSRLRLL